MKRITLVCGHYGSGKTNFALNLAVNAAKRGEKITLVDLDIVNPYFRTADYKAELEATGVNVIAQNLEGTTLNAPALTARMLSICKESMGLSLRHIWQKYARRTSRATSARMPIRRIRRRGSSFSRCQHCDARQSRACRTSPVSYTHLVELRATH